MSKLPYITPGIPLTPTPEAAAMVNLSFKTGKSSILIPKIRKADPKDLDELPGIADFLEGNIGITEKINKKLSESIAAPIQDEKLKEQFIQVSKWPEEMGMKSLEKVIVSSMMENYKPLVDLAKIFMELLSAMEDTGARLLGTFNPVGPSGNWSNNPRRQSEFFRQDSDGLGLSPVGTKALSDVLNKEQKVIRQAIKIGNKSKITNTQIEGLPSESNDDDALPKRLYIGCFDANGAVTTPPDWVKNSDRWLGQFDQLHKWQDIKEQNIKSFNKALDIVKDNIPKTDGDTLGPAQVSKKGLCKKADGSNDDEDVDLAKEFANAYTDDELQSLWRDWYENHGQLDVRYSLDTGAKLYDAKLASDITKDGGRVTYFGHPHEKQEITIKPLKVIGEINQEWQDLITPINAYWLPQINNQTGVVETQTNILNTFKANFNTFWTDYLNSTVISSAKKFNKEFYFTSAAKQHTVKNGIIQTLNTEIGVLENKIITETAEQLKVVEMIDKNLYLSSITLDYTLLNQIFYEDFEGVLSGWTITNSFEPNYWTVSTNSPIEGSKSAYITSGSGNQYDNSLASTTHLSRNFNYYDGSGWTLSFDWSVAGNSNDYGYISLTPTGETITAGSNVNISYKITDLSATTGSTYTGLINKGKIVWAWTNNADMAGVNPPLQIDKVYIAPTGLTTSLGTKDYTDYNLYITDFNYIKTEISSITQEILVLKNSAYSIPTLQWGTSSAITYLQNLDNYYTQSIASAETRIVVLNNQITALQASIVKDNELIRLADIQIAQQVVVDNEIAKLGVLQNNYNTARAGAFAQVSDTDAEGKWTINSPGYLKRDLYQVPGYVKDYWAGTYIQEVVEYEIYSTIFTATGETRGDFIKTEVEKTPIRIEPETDYKIRLIRVTNNSLLADQIPGIVRNPTKGLELQDRSNRGAKDFIKRDSGNILSPVDPLKESWVYDPSWNGWIVEIVKPTIEEVLAEEGETDSGSDTEKKNKRKKKGPKFYKLPHSVGAATYFASKGVPVIVKKLVPWIKATKKLVTDPPEAVWDGVVDPKIKPNFPAFDKDKKSDTFWFDSKMVLDGKAVIPVPIFGFTIMLDEAKPYFFKNKKDDPTKPETDSSKYKKTPKWKDKNIPLPETKVPAGRDIPELPRDQPIFKIITSIIMLPVQIVKEILCFIIEFVKKLAKVPSIPKNVKEFLTFKWLIGKVADKGSFLGPLKEGIITPDTLLKMVGIEVDPGYAVELINLIKNTPKSQLKDLKMRGEKIDLNKIISAPFLAKFPEFTGEEAKDLITKPIEYLKWLICFIQDLINAAINIPISLLGLEALGISLPKLKICEKINIPDPEDVAKYEAQDKVSTGTGEFDTGGEQTFKSGEKLTFEVDFEGQLPEYITMSDGLDFNEKRLAKPWIFNYIIPNFEGRINFKFKAYRGGKEIAIKTDSILVKNG